MIKRKLTLAIAALCVLQAAQASNETQAQDDFLLLEQEKANNQVYKAFFPNLEIARKAAKKVAKNQGTKYYKKYKKPLGFCAKNFGVKVPKKK